MLAGRTKTGRVSPEPASAFAAISKLRYRGEVGRDADTFDRGIGQKYT